MDLPIKLYWGRWMPSNEKKFGAAIQSINGYKESIRSVSITNRYSENIRNKTLNDVVAVSTTDCRMFNPIPRNLKDFFPNMTALDLENCGFNKITRNDLKGLGKLKEIVLREMDIKELPSDLFTDLVNLEVIELMDNKIKFIGKDIFKHLKKLKYVDLTGNPSINLVFAVAEYKDLEIDENASRVFNYYELSAILDTIYHSAVKTDPKPQVRSLEFEMKHSSPTTSTTLPTNNVYNDIKKILKSSDFKDFTIKINKNETKVHKFMLAARSPTLAEMIRNNPDADELILTDIEVEIFKIIIYYIYDDEMPQKYDKNSEKVFAAAGKLKLDPLKQKVGDILCDAVNPENSFEMLKLASKFNHENLKKKSFDELKKNFPGQSVKDEWIDNLEMLQKMIDAKSAYERKIKQAQEEFEKFVF